MKIVIAIAFVAAGCASPIVGAECRWGLSQCGSSCVDLQRDPLNCGGCGRVCQGVEMCIGGACTDVAASDDGGTPVDAGHASMPDASTSADAGTDAGRVVGPLGCGLGERKCGEECVRPDTDAMNCGECGVVCASDQLCSGGACVDACEAPLAMCGSSCLDLSSDPDNCGGCGRSCTTGVCSSGVCSAPLAGHVVAIGHDNRVRRDPMDRVAGNAVLLRGGGVVHALVYEGDASPESIAGTDAAITRIATMSGRSWTRTIARREDVPYQLADADVLVVYSQSSASDATLDALGLEWGRALMGFLDAGGVVVVFEGAGANAGTHRILTSAGLLEDAVGQDISGSIVEVRNAADAIALAVPLRYRAETSSVRMNGLTDGVVITDATGGPVVVHRVVRP